MLLGAGDGLHLLVHLGDGDAGHALLALDVHHGVAELQGDAVVVQALDDVALQAAGIGHDLRHDLDLCALEGQTAGHDEADVAAAQDDHLPAGHIALHVDQTLGRTGAVDARGTEARDVQRAAAALTAAHGQDDGPRLDLEQAVNLVHGGDDLVRADGEDHGQELIFDAALKHLVDEALGVLGAGQLLLEGVQAEAVVDALVQDAAQLVVALQDQDAPIPGVVCGNRCRKTGGAAADDNNIIFHGATS